MEPLNLSVEAILRCPDCGQKHIDEGTWKTRTHTKHLCEHCGHTWKPYDFPTVGVKRRRMLYRYYDDLEGSYNITRLLEYPILKESDKSFWYDPNAYISFFGVGRLPDKKEWKRVGKNTRVRHCYQTKELAWESYRRRKQVHLNKVKVEYDLAKIRWNAIFQQVTPPEGDRFEISCKPYNFIV